MSDCKAFILHLERARQRRSQAEAIAAATPMPTEILAAVDGAALSDAEVAKVYTRQLHAPRFYLGLNRAEIGAFLSHRAAWRRIVEDGLDFGLVFEDDAHIDAAAFARTCAFAKASRSQWDYALAPAMNRRPGAGQRVTLNHPSAPPLRALAQFVSNAAARRLLAVTERFDRPVDTFLQMSWVTGLELLTFTPSGVFEISESLGGSTIQHPSKSAQEKLWRELSRPIYRAQVRLYHAFAARPHP
ncbi:GR25 family glycosyltransferase involved in LPS biosynthesis [Rhodoblastus acidophilus]|uniref:glycosyltransferase family 25 protein n=1 Tax=Rhodoblastus acidophilus TaxID=1074 RepID=UPI00222417CF|nr:glycosyltransferase family 25 protein [Rhodoblastus acidophilus]MCW2283876.1 GR25 family glycosyltransferase involved in LPS biosynthesis [Rhodoblastus acidophilus]MCW2332572.1 GR25 family glycosyltransferase involved in LPS biosynthesis [Rhodoblastus acidophilus]